jgi:hypothetical protein
MSLESALAPTISDIFDEMIDENVDEKQLDEKIKNLGIWIKDEFKRHKLEREIEKIADIPKVYLVKKLCGCYIDIRNFKPCDCKN